MNEFNKKIIKIIELIEVAANDIEDNPEVEEYVGEALCSTEYYDYIFDYEAKLAVLEYVEIAIRKELIELDKQIVI